MKTTTIKQMRHDHGTVFAWVAASVLLDAKAFFTFDVRQKALAQKAGLKVRP